MVKLWIYAFIGVAIFLNVAKCDHDRSLLENSEELIKNFPRYLEEAFREEEEANANVSARFLSKHKCFKDYLKIFVGIARRKMWAVQGMI